MIHRIKQENIFTRIIFVQYRLWRESIAHQSQLFYLLNTAIRSCIISVLTGVALYIPSTCIFDSTIKFNIFSYLILSFCDKCCNTRFLGLKPSKATSKKSNRMHKKYPSKLMKFLYSFCFYVLALKYVNNLCVLSFAWSVTVFFLFCSLIPFYFISHHHLSIPLLHTANLYNAQTQTTIFTLFSFVFLHNTQ